MERPRALEPVVVRLGAEDLRSARVARRHVDLLFVRRDAELGEPEAVLLDEVEREPVAPGGIGARSASVWRSVPPGSTVRSSGVRSPSQTIGFPRSSSQ